MKTSEVLWRQLVPRLAVWMALLVMAGCATPTASRSDSEVASRVVRLKREARSSMDEGKTWRELRSGNVLAPGSLAETAADPDAYLDVTLVIPVGGGATNKVPSGQVFNCLNGETSLDAG